MTKRDIQTIQQAINVLLKHANSDKYNLDTEHYFFDAVQELENLINYLKRNNIIGDFGKDSYYIPLFKILNLNKCLLFKLVKDIFKLKKDSKVLKGEPV